jgi:hypothetical protein
MTYSNLDSHGVDNLINTCKNKSACIKGRCIEENGRQILGIQECCKESADEGILYYVDLEKAFNSEE